MTHKKSFSFMKRGVGGVCYAKNRQQEDINNKY